MKKALITGVTGQDGSYLSEFLLSKGFEVHGLIRRASTFNTCRIDHIYSDPHEPGTHFFLHYGDLSDSEQISDILYNTKPGEVYNLGAQSHVKVSFSMPEYTGNVTGLGTTRLLEAIRRSDNNVKLYQASSSEMFGRSPSLKRSRRRLTLQVLMRSQGLLLLDDAKLPSGLWNVCVQRHSFNHESPRRGEIFVTRKTTMAVASIIAKKQRVLFLGNLEPKRDWGYAPEYVEIMWRILQQDEPDDFVVGTGEQHTVREFVEQAFAYAGLQWEDHVKIDKKYFRPTETEDLVADSSKIKNTFGWKPKIGFRDLIKIMVDADMRK